VVTDQAAATGVGAVPNPSGIDGNPDSDFFVWQALVEDFIFGDATGLRSNQGRVFQIDSKAMRKVGPNEDIVMIADLNSSVGAIMITHGRRLIQLH